MAESLDELRKRYVDDARPLPKEIERALLSDPRRGASAIVAAVHRRRQGNRSEGQRLRRMLRYERELRKDGSVRIAGVDEAGMSPLAGPVVAAAVILPADFRVPGVDDSKKLKATQREELADVIRARASSWAVGRAEPDEIDRINIYHAGLLAMRRAVEGLTERPDHLLIDARALPQLTIPQTSIIKGDEKSLTIAAASILAKTARDAHMEAMDRQYPGYGLAKHKGYPVKQHVEAIHRLGVLPIHRRSFTPVREALGLIP